MSPELVVRAACDFAGCAYIACARTVERARAYYADHVKAVHMREVRLAASGSDQDAETLTSPNLRDARAVVKRRT